MTIDEQNLFLSIESLIEKRIKRLDNLKKLSVNDYVEKEVSIYIFEYSECSKKESKDKLKDAFGNIGENIIYQITSKELPFSCEKLKEKFDELKKENYHMSKINEEYWNSNLSKYCLYVGSKRDDAITRFKQHLGLTKNRSTYSLYLSKWWEPSIELQFKIFEFGKNIDPDLLQLLEDILWEKYEPLLGKQGSNNK